MNKILVSMKGIDKRFPGVHALNQCQFELRAGEVHALVGENGAGKSTLVKILTGVYTKDAGQIIYKGQGIDIPNPKTAQEYGINIIHQEFNLIPHLTIAQNIFIGRESRKWLRFILDDKEINRKTKELLDMINIDLDPETKVSDLSVAKQQMVEIAKALSFNSSVLIMDEPTAALADSEIEDLFAIIRRLRDDGVGIIYISHRLEELRMIADRVTVMRDGNYIGTMEMKDVTIDEIIKMMVGREIYETSGQKADESSHELMLEVRGLNRGKILEDINFYVKKGEIVGFAGLMGAGRTEVARAIFGADPIDSGEIYVRGQKVSIKSPKDAIRHGIGYLSEDRKRYGVALNLDVETNIVLAKFEAFTRLFGWVDREKTKAQAKQRVDELQIRTPSLNQKVKYLSGGNQQKVVLGKSLLIEPKVLVLDEPTRGIDVGAKFEIYKIMNQLVREGVIVIMISSELEEILGMSDRILVMSEGKICVELEASEATQEKIMRASTGGGL